MSTIQEYPYRKIRTWEEYDLERARRMANIKEIERKLERAKEHLANLQEMVVRRLDTITGGRDKK